MTRRGGDTLRRSLFLSMKHRGNPVLFLNRVINRLIIVFICSHSESRNPDFIALVPGFRREDV